MAAQIGVVHAQRRRLDTELRADTRHSHSRRLGLVGKPDILGNLAEGIAAGILEVLARLPVLHSLSV